MIAPFFSARLVAATTLPTAAATPLDSAWRGYLPTELFATLPSHLKHRAGQKQEVQQADDTRPDVQAAGSCRENTTSELQRSGHVWPPDAGVRRTMIEALLQSGKWILWDSGRSATG